MNDSIHVCNSKRVELFICASFNSSVQPDDFLAVTALETDHLLITWIYVDGTRNSSEKVTYRWTRNSLEDVHGIRNFHD